MSTHNIGFYEEAILMSTHNIGFCEDLTKIIFELSSNMHLIEKVSTCMSNILLSNWYNMHNQESLFFFLFCISCYKTIFLIKVILIFSGIQPRPVWQWYWSHPLAEGPHPGLCIPYGQGRGEYGSPWWGCHSTWQREIDGSRVTNIRYEGERRF